MQNTIQNFGALMQEVKFGDTTTSEAASRIDEYVRQEVERRCGHILDLTIGLHPLQMVQHCADRVKADPGQVSVALVGKLLQEYAMLLRRMEDERLLLAVENMPRPRLPEPLHSAEKQLFAALKELGEAQGDGLDK
jgi:hypothetical protein